MRRRSGVTVDEFEVCGSFAIHRNLKAGVYQVLRVIIKVVCKWRKSVGETSEEHGGREMGFSPKMILLRPVKIVARWG